jgi:hypothetical protein
MNPAIVTAVLVVALAVVVVVAADVDARTSAATREWGAGEDGCQPPFPESHPGR